MPRGIPAATIALKTLGFVSIFNFLAALPFDFNYLPARQQASDT